MATYKVDDKVYIKKEKNAAGELIFGYVCCVLVDELTGIVWYRLKEQLWNNGPPQWRRGGQVTGEKWYKRKELKAEKN